MTPQRIQLSRKRGWRLQEASLALNGLPAVKVDRSTNWGNPYTAAHFVGVPPALLVDLFRDHMNDSDSDKAQWKRENLGKLRGKNVACWCPLPEHGQPDHCHATVLLALANRQEATGG